MNEEWKQLGRYKKDRCFISNYGNIIMNGEVFVPNKNNCGYLMFKGALIHRLVVEKFAGPIEKGLVVDHVDGNKTNNKITNLEVTTREENSRRAGKKNKSHKNSFELNLYTIRNIPADQYRLLRIRAAGQEMSINKLLLKLIEQETAGLKNK